MRGEKLRSTDAVIVRFVEIRSDNLHVCSHVVAILLPRGRCRPPYGDSPLKLSETYSTINILQQGTVELSLSLARADQVGYTLSLYASNLSQLNRWKKFNFLLLFENALPNDGVGCLQFRKRVFCTFSPQNLVRQKIMKNFIVSFFHRNLSCITKT
jgi:hypothetical protein